MTETPNEDFWRATQISAGELHDMFLGVSAGIKEAFAEAMEADEESSQAVKLSKIALFHQTHALECMAAAVRQFSESKFAPPQLLHTRLIESTVPLCKAAGRPAGVVKIDEGNLGETTIICEDCSKVIDYYKTHGMQNPIPDVKTL